VSRLTDALSWSGRDVTLIIFALWRSDPGVVHPPDGAHTSPTRVRTYHMDDPDQYSIPLRCREYDLVFNQLPGDIPEIVTSWLAAMLRSGAEVAWFAFEGSFDFKHLLTADIANQVFAVADSAGISLALSDEYRESMTWADSVVAIKARLAI
jgi:hypothetical protein